MVQGSIADKSSRLSRSGSARMSISTTLPPAIVNPITDSTRPLASRDTTPTLPLTVVAPVFVTVEPKGKTVDILVEDDGPGIPEEKRGELFARGARLDTTGKPGTGLGLAIVRDVAEIYGGTIHLEESEDLGGLLARLSLPSG